MKNDLPVLLHTARALFDDLTPLHTDCGRLCAGRCCQPMEGENTGMLLFPGEAAYYENLPGYTVKSTPAGQLLTCSGSCHREDRPLSCRLFPLIPVLRPDGVKVTTDLRAKPVCPLARQGKSALQQEFVAAVRTCGQLLAEDEEQRRFLTKLTAQQDDLRALRHQFGGE
ncbi:MAG: hypothetical protein IJX84_08935 [Clostridia bacterium]|nr:hypothetical protein [Clostridia bacterium]